MVSLNIKTASTPNLEQFANAWVDERVKKHFKSQRTQKYWLMQELAKLCVAETQKHNKDETDLEVRLAETLDIIDSIQYETAPTPAKESRWTIEDHAKEDIWTHVVWSRRDPKRSFREGFKSDAHLDYDKTSFQNTVTDYLKRTWLRHPIMDWIFLDILITGELCAYGESVKKWLLPGKKDDLGMHPNYYQAEGSIERMQKINWDKFLKSNIDMFFSGLVFPTAAIWAAFHYGWEKTGIALLSAYSLIAVIYVGNKAWLLAKNVFLRVLGKSNPHAVSIELWENMYQVWQGLSDPVINPTVIRETMHKSTEKGAVWDGAAWALIDRVVAHDPALWIVRQGD